MNSNYEIVVGLEVHAELSTETKIFCGCKNKFGSEVNTNVCPVCMGLPGTLPVLNEQVVEYAIKMGHALNCKINGTTKLAEMEQRSRMAADRDVAHLYTAIMVEIINP